MKVIPIFLKGVKMRCNAAAIVISLFFCEQSLIFASNIEPVLSQRLPIDFMAREFSRHLDLVTLIRLSATSKNMYRLLEYAKKEALFFSKVRLDTLYYDERLVLDPDNKRYIINRDRSEGFLQGWAMGTLGCKRDIDLFFIKDAFIDNHVYESPFVLKEKIHLAGCCYNRYTINEEKFEEFFQDSMVTILPMVRALPCQILYEYESGLEYPLDLSKLISLLNDFREMEHSCRTYYSFKNMRWAELLDINVAMLINTLEFNERLAFVIDRHDNTLLHMLSMIFSVQGVRDVIKYLVKSGLA